MEKIRIRDPETFRIPNTVLILNEILCAISKIAS